MCISTSLFTLMTYFPYDSLLNLSFIGIHVHISHCIVPRVVHSVYMHSLICRAIRLGVKMFFAVENSPRSRKPIININEENFNRHDLKFGWILFKSQESRKVNYEGAKKEATKLWNRKRNPPAESPHILDLDRITAICESVQKKLDSLFPETCQWKSPSSAALPSNDPYLRSQCCSSRSFAAFPWEDRSPERNVTNDLVHYTQTSCRTSYVWAKRKRFKSLIHPMREPDLIGDDLAVRKWNPDLI